MKKMKYLAVLLVLCVFASGCSGKQTVALQQQVEQLTAQNKQLTTQTEQLTQALEELQQKLDTAEQAVPVPANEQAIIDSLMLRLDLIPVEGVLGGTMRYYPDETRVLDTQHVYAYADDGHILVYMLLEYSGETSFDWKLIAYNSSGSWQLA